MSDDKTYTERDVVLRARAAFLKGCEFVGGNAPWQEVRDRAAAERYPLPKVTRPRVAQDHEYKDQWGKPREWRYVGGQFQSRTIGCIGATDVEFAWATTSQAPITRHRVKMWADLYANPTEEVEE